ncbi:hypothetical protein ACI65C_010003 [Semiaphis heraclei]
MSFMLHPLSSDLTRWHVVNSREARVLRAVFTSVCVPRKTTKIWGRGARTDPDNDGQRLDGGGKKICIIKQSTPSRGKIGHSRVISDLVKRTSSDRESIAYGIGRFAEILSAVIVCRVWISRRWRLRVAAQQNRKPNCRVAVRRLTLTAVESTNRWT